MYSMHRAIVEARADFVVEKLTALMDDKNDSRMLEYHRHCVKTGRFRTTNKKCRSVIRLTCKNANDTFVVVEGTLNIHPPCEENRS